MNSSPAQQFNQMLTGYWMTQSIYVAAKLGLADLLKDGPRSVDQLASASGAHAPSLFRLLRGLSSVGMFAEKEPRIFVLTPLAECLRRDLPGSQWALAMMSGEEHYRAFGDMLYSVRTGKPAFDHVYGAPVFDFLSAHPEQSTLFDAAMVGVHGRETAAMLEVYDFADVPILADVGGGNGSLLTTVLKKYPAMKGMLYDLPGTVGRSKETIQASGVGDRLRVVEGSFFEAIPTGADAYLMRHIIHDWDDERSITILQNVHRAMAATGKLLVVETVIQPGNENDFGKLLDLVMLVIPGGKERTEDEYRKLFAAAGFRLTRVVPAVGVCVIEGRKA
jgi:hypothetical protein